MIAYTFDPRLVATRIARMNGIPNHLDIFIVRLPFALGAFVDLPGVEPGLRSVDPRTLSRNKPAKNSKINGGFGLRRAARD